MVTKKERGKRDKEYGINRYTLLYVKEISNKDLLYSTKNYIQYFVIIYNGKYIYITESLCSTSETNTEL